MKLFSKIKNLFGRKKHVSNNSIIFSVENGYATMSMYLVDTDDKSCDLLAELLFNIGEGNYQKSILDMIVNMSQSNPEISDVLESILIKWGVLLAKTDNQFTQENIGQQPVIRPRNVFLGGK